MIRDGVRENELHNAMPGFFKPHEVSVCSEGDRVIVIMDRNAWDNHFIPALGEYQYCDDF